MVIILRNWITQKLLEVRYRDIQGVHFILIEWFMVIIFESMDQLTKIIFYYIQLHLGNQPP